MMLHIDRAAADGFAPLSICKVVGSFEDASRAYSAVRDETGEGASTFPFGRVTADGEEYLVSYNGRVWSGERLVYDPSAPTGVSVKRTQEEDGRTVVWAVGSAAELARVASHVEKIAAPVGGGWQAKLLDQDQALATTDQALEALLNTPTTIPISLPETRGQLRGRCEKCRGTGKTGRRPRRCSACSGSGEVVAQILPSREDLDTLMRAAKILEDLGDPAAARAVKHTTSILTGLVLSIRV